MCGLAIDIVDQMLSDCCSDRLESYRKWVGVATLRSFELDGIPEDFTMEPLNGVYRLICFLRRVHRVELVLYQLS